MCVCLSLVAFRSSLEEDETRERENVCVCVCVGEEVSDDGCRWMEHSAKHKSRVEDEKRERKKGDASIWCLFCSLCKSRAPI